MTKQEFNASYVDPDDIIDRIYQVSLEPSTLESFMDHWQRFEAASRPEDVSAYDPRLDRHLERAQTILHQQSDAPNPFDVELARFPNLAAFCVNQSFIVQAANYGATSSYHLKVGDHLKAITLPDDLRDVLFRSVREALRPGGKEHLLRADLPEKSGSLLLRVTPLPQTNSEGPIALVAGNSLDWLPSTDVLLNGFYRLTEAEAQVVRLLLNGQDVRSIARIRGTTEGTIRAQSKSIMSKMNVGSKADVVRLAMALVALGGGSQELSAPQAQFPTSKPNDWLENEVWKPMKSMVLPDGRELTYHDMGPENGKPVLLSHMGSCMVRWPGRMVEAAFDHDLRVICPIRAGYGHSQQLPHGIDPISAGTEDSIVLLDLLGIGAVPHVVSGTDFPFAVDLATQHPDRVTEIIGVGARPALPDGRSTEGPGLWQRFFFSTARKAPHLVRFSARALMSMCKRIGPEAMLRQLCKESPSDMALLREGDVREVLVANVALMAGRSTNSAVALAEEFIAFQNGWGAKARAMPSMPIQLFLAEEDPTLDFSMLPELREAFPEMAFQVLPKAGLALMFQQDRVLIPRIAEAAHRVAKTA